MSTIKELRKNYRDAERAYKRGLLKFVDNEEYYGRKTDLEWEAFYAYHNEYDGQKLAHAMHTAQDALEDAIEDERECAVAERDRYMKTLMASTDGMLRAFYDLAKSVAGKTGGELK
jgi:hypothetical protein